MTGDPYVRFSRRRALKLLAASAFLLGARPAIAASRKRVSIIGAGASGIAAAKALQDAGCSVTLFEGRDRIGGRIWSDRSLGATIDMGAAWIQGSANDHPMFKLAREHSIKITPTLFESVDVYGPKGEQIAEDKLEEFEREADDLLESLEAFAEKQSRDMSVADALEQVLAGESLSKEEEFMLYWLMSAGEADAAANIEELSLLSLDEGEDFGDEDYIFPGGYVQIFDQLSKGLDVRLGTVVREVRYDAKGVTLVTDNGEHECDCVLVTASLGLLQKQSIKFSPALPASKVAAFGKLRMGVLDKVALRFPRAFWKTGSHFLGYVSERRGEFPVFLNYHQVNGEPILVGFVSGREARRVESLSDEQAAREAMAILRRIYGNGIPEPSRVTVARWASDPWALGSYSFVGVGGDVSARDALAEPIASKIYFAGEATSRQYAATVHGAYLSGLREAKKIMAA